MASSPCMPVGAAEAGGPHRLPRVYSPTACTRLWKGQIGALRSCPAVLSCALDPVPVLT